MYVCDTQAKLKGSDDVDDSEEFLSALWVNGMRIKRQSTVRKNHKQNHPESPLVSKALSLENIKKKKKTDGNLDGNGSEQYMRFSSKQISWDEI